MREEVEAGQSPGDAAAVMRAGLAMPVAGVVQRLLEAARALDGHGVAEALAAARQVHGLARTVEEVVVPVMREIGAQWADGRCGVSHEHVLSAGVDHWLHQQEQAAPPPTRPGLVVLACGPADLHTIGLRALGALVAWQGVDCLTLGALTPVEALRQAVQDAPAQSVVVVSQLTRARPAAIAAIRAAATTTARVYFAGASFDSPRSRTAVPGTYLGTHLGAAAAHLAGTATGRLEHIGVGPRH